MSTKCTIRKSLEEDEDRNIFIGAILIVVILIGFLGYIFYPVVNPCPMIEDPLKSQACLQVRFGDFYLAEIDSGNSSYARNNTQVDILISRLELFSVDAPSWILIDDLNLDNDTELKTYLTEELGRSFPIDIDQHTEFFFTSMGGLIEETNASLVGTLKDTMWTFQYLQKVIALKTLEVIVYTRNATDVDFLSNKAYDFSPLYQSFDLVTFIENIPETLLTKPGDCLTIEIQAAEWDIATDEIIGIIITLNGGSPFTINSSATLPILD